MSCKLHGQDCRGHAQYAKHDRRILELSEIVALVRIAKSPIERAIVLCMYDLALRAGEVERLTWSNLDARESTISPSREKDGRSGYLGVSGETLRALLQVRRTGARIFPGWHEGKVRKLIRDLAKAAGFPKDKRYSHILRSSRASHLEEAGAKLKDIQRRLGHKSPQTTMVYLRLTERRKREIDTMAGNMINEALNATR